MKKSIIFGILSLFIVLLCNYTLNAKPTSPLIVGFIMIGSTNDGGYSQAQNTARLQLEKNLNIKTIYKENISEGVQVSHVIAQMIDQGAKVIVGGSFGYMDYMAKMAKIHPEIVFLHCSGYIQLKNMSNFFGRFYEGRFLAGLVAGLKTKELNNNKIGMVAAFPIPEVIRNINAFILGAQTVNSKATVEVIWTHTWYNPAKEKSAAETLLSKGYKMMAMYQDSPATLIAAKEHGAFSLGNDSDMKHFAPNSVLTSVVVNWYPYLEKQIKAVQNGTWESSSYWGGLKENIIQITPISEQATLGTQKLVDDYKAKIISGEYKIFSNHLIKDQSGKIRITKDQTLNDKQLKKIDWFVEGVIGTPK